MRRIVLALLAGVLAGGCDSKPSTDDTTAYEHVMAFDTAHARLAGSRDTLRLTLEIARSAEQRSMGLMERRQLADSAGMLFVFDSTQAPDAGFWMYRTRIPLDIAFLDSTGVIRAIRQMVPCPTTIAQGCPSYAPEVAYRYALEVSAGYFARHGVAVGNGLVLQDLPGPRPGTP